MYNLMKKINLLRLKKKSSLISFNGRSMEMGFIGDPMGQKNIVKDYNLLQIG